MAHSTSQIPISPVNDLLDVVEKATAEDLTDSSDVQLPIPSLERFLNEEGAFLSPTSQPRPLHPF